MAKHTTTSEKKSDLWRILGITLLFICSGIVLYMMIDSDLKDNEKCNQLYGEGKWARINSTCYRIEQENPQIIYDHYTATIYEDDQGYLYINIDEINHAQKE